MKTKITRDIAPALGVQSFSCPRCGALAHQTWYRLRATAYPEGHRPQASVPTGQSGGVTVVTGDIVLQKAHQMSSDMEVGNVTLSKCFSCKRFSIWQGAHLVFPSHTTEVEPHHDMPEAARDDFKEAAAIVDFSPRGAAALLRLALQKMMPSLDEKGDNLNADIGNLVKKGLDPRIQQALDVLRVIGNNAVHPGEIDLKADKETAMALFSILNTIVATMISARVQIDTIYGSLPPAAKAAIEKRDKP